MFSRHEPLVTGGMRCAWLAFERCWLPIQAKVEGRLKVYFYDTEAGSRDIEPTAIPARASPQVLLRGFCGGSCLWHSCKREGYRP